MESEGQFYSGVSGSGEIFIEDRAGDRGRFGLMIDQFGSDTRRSPSNECQSVTWNSGVLQ
jgi:hypothetical protein